MSRCFLKRVALGATVAVVIAAGGVAGLVFGLGLSGMTLAAAGFGVNVVATLAGNMIGDRVHARRGHLCPAPRPQADVIADGA